MTQPPSPPLGSDVDVAASGPGAEAVEVVHDGPIVRVFLNRPAVHNAFDGATIEALIAAFEAAAANPRARVLVLGGRGRSFCAGADLKWMAAAGARDAAGDGDNLAGARALARLFDVVNDSPVPVIGRVHGAARGGGTGLVACCDIPVASARASFAFTEARLGLAPAVISPYVLARVGTAAARELFLTGARIDAARAREVGLVQYVEDDEAALDARVDALAADIIKGGPRAVAACKRLAIEVPRMPRERVLAHTAGVIAALRASEEGQEGMAAFLARRPPAWVLEAQGEVALTGTTEAAAPEGPGKGERA